VGDRISLLGSTIEIKRAGLAEIRVGRAVVARKRSVRPWRS